MKVKSIEINGIGGIESLNVDFNEKMNLFEAFFEEYKSILEN